MSNPESSGGEPVKDVVSKRVKPQDVISKRDLTRSVMGLFNTSECFPILSYFFFVIVYAMCFVCLFKTNIEFIAWWFFFVLNFLFMLFIIKEFVYNQQVSNRLIKNSMYLLPDHISNAISSYTYMVTGNIQGKIHIPVIILIGAMSAFVPLVFMVIVFQKLHLETRTQNMDREFGNQLKKKKRLKKLLIAQIVALWALYIMYNAYQPLFFFISYYFLYHLNAQSSGKVVFIAFNIIYIMLSSAVLAFGGYNTWLAYSIAKHTGSLSNPLISK